MPKVLLFELNEVNWVVLRGLLDRGELPNLKTLMERGASGTTICRDKRLDPCVAWPTLHTGTSHEVHRIDFLGQHPQTFGARQIWDFAIEAGRKVGVFGSLLSWPPRPTAAFHVPECFARDAETQPETMRPVQAFNIKYSTENKKALVAKTSLRELVTFTYGLLRSGVRPATFLEIGREILEESRRPHLKWRRACLQPIINYDVFAKLYRQTRPHFSTFFTNHVAYYLHRYWRACFPEQFTAAPESEVGRYHDTIPYSLRLSDLLIGRVMSLIGDDTVLIVASALGQGPLAEPQNSPQQNVLRSLHRLIALLGHTEQAHVSGSMTHEHVLVVPAPAARAEIVRQLSEIRQAGGAQARIFNVAVKDDTVCVAFRGEYEDLEPGIFIPALGQTVPAHEIDIARYDVQPMTGDHTPDGLFVMTGPTVRPGYSLGEFDLRSVAPTILSLLDVAVPPQMQGARLHQAFH
jgi:predicted AlkP superfamily phosphohydrolase/phosphomutase